jgi:hypothetical protein
MKSIILFILLSVKFCFSQNLDYKNFKPELMNNALLREFNNYRRDINIDTLVYSKSLHLDISKPNCVEVSKSGGFYHPDISDVWFNTNLKKRISEESIKLIGGTLKKHSDGSFWMDTYENAFLFELYRAKSDNVKVFSTYEELAKYTIYRWSISTKGHREVQMMSFTSMGLPGMFSCHSEINDKGVVFVFMNFVRVHRL